MATTAELSDNTLKQSEDRKSSILNNIKQLQEMESSLYKKLEASAASDSSTTQQEAIVNKINELSTMRMTMFSELDSLFKSTQGRVAQSRIDLVDQLTTTGVMETELNNTKSNLNYLRSNKDNKMRMVEINTYYASKYQAQSGLMKLIILVCIPLLVLAILSKKNILPTNIANGLIGLIIVVGGFIIIKRTLNLSSRNNMNYDEFDWVWDPDASDPTVIEYDEEQIEADLPSFTDTLGLGCIGAECCSTGMYYDSETSKCERGIGKLDRPTTSTSLEGFTTGRTAVSYVEVPETPCPFKQSKTVVKPYSENTYNYVKVSAR